MARRSVGRGLNLLAKAQEDVEPGWLEGWLSLPLLPPSTAGCAFSRAPGAALQHYASAKTEGFLSHKRLHKKIAAHVSYVLQQPDHSF